LWGDWGNDVEGEELVKSRVGEWILLNGQLKCCYVVDWRQVLGELAVRMSCYEAGSCC
jgi:hypothetical protein